MRIAVQLPVFIQTIEPRLQQIGIILKTDMWKPNIQGIKSQTLKITKNVKIIKFPNKIAFEFIDFFKKNILKIFYHDFFFSKSCLLFTVFIFTYFSF